jgi:hypothetical protein
VWHDGDSPRIVLICDAWHPQLDVEAVVEPMLGDAQLADLAAARRHEHVPLDERAYSTGERVRREP